MKILTTVAVSLLALNITTTAFAEDGSMRYREMVENLREHFNTTEQAKDCAIGEDSKPLAE